MTGIYEGIGQILHSAINAKVLISLGIRMYEALELERVAPEFSVPYSILRESPLILGPPPNLGKAPLLLAYYPLFSGLTRYSNNSLYCFHHRDPEVRRSQITLVLT